MLFRDSRALAPSCSREMLGGIGGPCAPHRALPVALLLAEHASDRRGARALVRGPRLPRARRRAAMAATRTRTFSSSELGRQVLPDGVYFERATCYQRYTVEIYLHFLMLAARNGIALPAEVPERHGAHGRRAARAPRSRTARCRRSATPTGGRCCRSRRGRPMTCAACSRWRRPCSGAPDYAWAAQGAGARGAVAAAEPAACGTSSRCPPRPPDADGVARCCRRRVRRDAERLGSPRAPARRSTRGRSAARSARGHGHADLLSVQCAVFGEPASWIAGTYCYTAEPRVARLLPRHRGPQHGARRRPRPGGDARARSAGTRGRAPAACAGSHDGALDVADAEHDAYARLADPVTHRRRVLWIKPGYWLIVDDVDGAAAHAVEVRFQLAPSEWRWTRRWGSRVRRAGSGLFIRASRPRRSRRT